MRCIVVAVLLYSLFGTYVQFSENQTIGASFLPQFRPPMPTGQPSGTGDSQEWPSGAGTGFVVVFSILGAGLLLLIWRKSRRQGHLEGKTSGGKAFKGDD